MDPVSASPEHLYRSLLRLYPTEFRARFGDEMVQLFGDQLRDARTGAAGGGMARTWLRTLGDLLVTAVTEHARRDRTMAHSLTIAPTRATRALGILGIVGGLFLVSGYVFFIPGTFNTIRILFFDLGAIAIAVQFVRRQGTAVPRLVLAAATLVVVVNAWNIAMLLLSVGRPQLPDGDPQFRLVGFFAQAAVWLAAAAFGAVALRYQVGSRLGALVLAIGSVLAVSGIDRIGLVGGDLAWFFGPLAAFGAMMHGLGWILLGIDVATRRRSPDVQPAGPTE